MIPEFYTPNAAWQQQIEEILVLLGRVTLLEELSGNAPHLRRSNRISAVHSSTAIEGNTLSRLAVEALADGRAAVGTPRGVKEVENALAAYELLGELDPWKVDDLLRAHRVLTEALVPESGAFRSVPVYIEGPRGDLLHEGAPAQDVPDLIDGLLAWAAASEDHPLIVSSAVHFFIEYVHPFRDGNGRIGRLWQTLILARWRKEFLWLPTESLIRQRQQAYYEALRDSHSHRLDAATFISYMLDVVTETLRSYEAGAQGGRALREGRGVRDEDAGQTGQRSAHEE